MIETKETDFIEKKYGKHWFLNNPTVADPMLVNLWLQDERIIHLLEKILNELKAPNQEDM
ncbi:MAG: hypothetical protein ABIL58_00685 [Pseudomonadota bacterium]